MINLVEQAELAASDFKRVAALARPSTQIKLEINVALKPHIPPVFPAGSMAVYAFFWGAQCLKVGKVGPKSGVRYRYQHYHSNSASSTLAKSILQNQEKVNAGNLDVFSVAEWIKSETDRVGIMMPHNVEDAAILSLLEAFLHVRWRPMFEGRRAVI